MIAKVRFDQRDRTLVVLVSLVMLLLILREACV